MKHHILSRALSLTAAAVMSWPAAGGTGILQTAAAQAPPVQTRTTQSPARQTQSSEPVTVIVKVSGDAVMARPEAAEMGSDYLDTDAAARLTAQNKAQQRSVQNSIRQFYPELQVGFSYTALYNGFSCKLPQGLIERVRALPDVVSVTESQEIAVPQMNRAAALSGFPAYYDLTGCSGEGQVIAVIDSELDPTHPMFAPLADSIETAVSKDDVAEVINSGTLNVEADADRAYISSKLPFVMNYTKPDSPYDSISDLDSYHGTHVCGIAAGNTYETYDGTELSGIAKDAQLMFFGVGYGERFIDGTAGLAAMEDAVKLHADVINMSWGADGREYFGENPYAEAVSAADRAGVIICNSAGNGDNGYYSWNTPVIPENPDNNMMGDKAELGSPIMMVASANNTGLADAGVFYFNGSEITLMPMMDPANRVTFLSYCLQPGEYEYADCGNGTERDFEEAGDLSGKLALVQRNSVQAGTIADRAEAHGACGVLLIDLQNPDGMEYIFSESKLIVNGISWLDGQAMREAENKVLTITGETVKREYATSVSSYTAWGVKNSLDLRPDIMGIGGRVRSAAYYGGDETMSGTSMSSPYVAGCTAVLREYLKKQNIELTGSDFAAYVRRLMMNSAIPYKEDGVFVTPRRQGAGLVSLDRALATKVLMTGDAGDAKVNLFDKLGDSFSFDITLTNYSNEDVTYPQAEICLTTDGTCYDSEMKRDRTIGQQKLNCTSNFAGPVTLAAGESRTVTVSVALDAAQCRTLEEKFINGFFAEGYLLLSGADNSADISIPMLGYHGDWAKLPIMDPDDDHLLVRIGVNEESEPISIVRKGVILKQILARVPNGLLMKNAYDIEDYATEEELRQLKFRNNTYWISPNGDSIADQITGPAYCDPWRWHYRWAVEVLDEDGQSIYSLNPYEKDFVYKEIDYDELCDGNYTYLAKRWIDYPGSAENPQTYRCNLIIDRTEPEVRSEYMEENGRTYLVLHASDDRQLQGLLVTGIGKGGEAGVYEPGEKKQVIDKINFAERLYPDSYYGVDSLRALGFNNVDKLPYSLRSVGGCAEREGGKDFNFADALAAEPDEDGIWTVKYDITDLSLYYITVLDEAYNFVEIRSSGNAAEQLTAKPGLWYDLNQGYFEIDGDKLIHKSFQDGSVTEYRYTADKGKMTLVSGNQTKHYNVWYLSDTCFQMIDQDDNSVWMLSPYLNSDEAGLLIPVDHISQTKSFIPVKTLMEEVIKNGKERWSLEPEVIYCNICNEGEIEIDLNYTNESGFLIYEQYLINMISGRGHVSYSEQLDEKYELGVRQGGESLWFCEEYLSEIPAGLYQIEIDGDMIRFNEDGQTGTFLYFSGSSNSNGLFPCEDTPFTYSIGDDGNITIRYNDVTLQGILSSNQGYGGILIRVQDSETHYTQEWVFRLITDDPEKIAMLRSAEEYCQLATAYINAIACSDIRPYNTYRISFSADPFILYYSLVYDERAYNIDIDPFTLDVTDEEGNQGNLLNPPKMPDNAAYTMDEIKKMASKTFEDKTGIRSWHEMAVLTGDGRVMVILRGEYGEYLEIYYVDPVTGSIEPKLKRRGDVSCDGAVDVADAVMLARFLAEDREVIITDEGRANADCNLDQQVDETDIFHLLRAIARIIRF